MSLETHFQGNINGIQWQSQQIKENRDQMTEEMVVSCSETNLERGPSWEMENEF